METWKEVFQHGRNVAHRLKRRRVETTRYVGANDKTIVGWKLHRLYGYDLKNETYSRVPGDYMETWGDEYLVLGTDGTIYLCSVTKVEHGAARTGTGQVRIDETLYVYRMDPRTTQSQSYRQKINMQEVMNALKLLDK